MSDDINAALQDLRAQLDAIAAVQRSMLEELHLAGALRMQDVAGRMSSSPALFQANAKRPQNDKLHLMQKNIVALGEALDQFADTRPDQAAAAD